MDDGFKDKIRNLSFRARKADPKRTVDVHDNHKVVVTESGHVDNPRQDVNVFPAPVEARMTTNQEGNI